MGGHVPVMVAEVMGLLGLRPGEVYADCTAGLGGHAVEAARRVGLRGTVVLNDLDAGNLERAAGAVRKVCGGDGGGVPRVVRFQGNFAELPRRMEAEGLAADAVLADLGFASVQVEDASRGFSFMREGPLDMRYDASVGSSAAELVNGLPEDELASILREYGEEREAGRIARKLVAERAVEPISTTQRLAGIVRSVCGRSGGGIDPATRTFQALRIAVNDELGSLHGLLRAVERAAQSVAAGSASWLAPGGRVAVISFHSLEDRPVKRAFASLVDRGLACSLTRGHVGPGDAEVEANPRARSAKVRAIAIGGAAGDDRRR
ncbi:MAG: 16S rRNA (cytosine(1402)-N(4))-methyltransferase RsmH [Leptolyngbya sp. PLA2]|nr:16S rRNA (cytosine(1402)-N(4))-methyltransferase RsmH [Leptolyngbya sp. PL-A2]MCQ3940166.1 16S rRNA (cytosine(1402)-N(4))-methyltransferase RsmH [cyanobacterium CYA1]MDL1904097.1 16S rRNA (cytosine(1402)-N(4))-methyltransferase RsmH [Synechococcales cyanobacterium CNB]GIK20150.1 MAG: ribosomal RNA small subunit methyltransferase H [Planctomycetota bacterium]